MKNLLTCLLLFVAAPCASADSWRPQSPQTKSSPTGERLVRSIPPQRLDEKGKKWSKVLMIVYRMDRATQDYRETSRFSVEGRPLDFFINDAGDRIVTIDQYFGVGYGPRTVVVYSASGRELKKWALKDFYDKKKLERLPVTTSSILWHGTVQWIWDQKGILLSKAIPSDDKKSEFDDYLLDVYRLKISKLPPFKLK